MDINSLSYKIHSLNFCFLSSNTKFKANSKKKNELSCTKYKHNAMLINNFFAHEILTSTK